MDFPGKNETVRGNKRSGLEEATLKISQRLVNVDTKPWIGETFKLKVRSVSGNQIHLEVVTPNEEIDPKFSLLETKLSSYGSLHNTRQDANYNIAGILSSNGMQTNRPIVPVNQPSRPNQEQPENAIQILPYNFEPSIPPQKMAITPTASDQSASMFEVDRERVSDQEKEKEKLSPEMEGVDEGEQVTFGVEPQGYDLDNQKTYDLMPLKTSEYDLSLKVSSIIEYIRKKQSVIFEGSRFSGKRRCIVGSIISRINPYNMYKTRILVITFERESAEYFYKQVSAKISHMAGVRSSLCVGSTKVRDNVRELEQGCQIVFGTPARLVDLLTRGVLKLGEVIFVAMYCNRHLPAEFQEPLQSITRHLPSNFQYLITYPLGAKFDFKLLQTYTFKSFGKHIAIVDNVPHFHRLNVIAEPLYKRDVMWMLQNQQRIGLVCDRSDLQMVDMWLGDLPCPVKCLIPTYRKLPSKGRERRHYIKQSKTLFQERVEQYKWGILIILQESVKFAPCSLDGSLDAIILIGNTKLHDPEYRDHMLVRPGGHIFLNVPDLQFRSSQPSIVTESHEGAGATTQIPQPVAV